MGFDVKTFNFIIDSGFQELWDHTPIPRYDTSSSGNPRPRRRSLDVNGALGLVLHYLNSTVVELSLQEVFGLIPSTVSRYITFSLKILLNILRRIPDSRIQWPRNQQQFQNYTNLITARHPRLHEAFATIDGLNLMVETANDMDVENATYNGWLSEHFISSVIVFAPDERTPDGFYLIADTAFPWGMASIEGRIVAPMKAGQTITGTQEQIEEKAVFDREVISYR
ncbi:hypothetical protein BC826DRAFT_976777, partial [Russula brevipes]